MYDTIEGVVNVVFPWKKHKLEKQLMEELKAAAGVGDAFPKEDALNLGRLLSWYNTGHTNFAYNMLAYETMEKYPGLVKQWDSIIVKYKKLGLFPKYNIEE